MQGIKNLYKWVKRHIWELVLIIFLNTTLQILYSYLPLFVQYAFKVLNRQISGTDDTTVNLPPLLIRFFEKGSDALTIILIVGISMVSLQLVRSLMRYFCNFSTGKLTEDIAKDMRLSLYNHITDLSYSYHNNVDTGDLIQRSTSDIDTSSSFISSHFPNLLNIFVTISMGAYQVYFISPTLMWVSLIIVPITAVSSIIFFKYVAKAFLDIEKSESAMTTVIQENVNSARIVRAFANEKYEFEKMDEANRIYSKKHQKFINRMAMYWGFSDFTVMFQYTLTIGVAIYLAQKGLVGAPDIIACLLLMGMLVWPMRGLGRIISNFGMTVVAVNRIEEVLKEPSEYEINGKEEPKIDGNIEFKDVWFKFKDGSDYLLKGVSFDIKKGETVAIVGKTGSGKSTICSLLTRMYEYDKGSILVDGVELKDIEKHYLRRNIKMVLQDPFLFSKTIYENIAITNKNASEADVFEAAKVASFHDEIISFEKGYKTLVGEKGTTLSGGQKQRVAIARILVSNSPVIVFDDSLSALDTKTDVLIRNALQRRNKEQTMVVVTHRTTTAKEADKIVVLDSGYVAEIGTHEELVSKEGLYKDLWGIQGELEAEFNKVMKGDDK